MNGLFTGETVPKGQAARKKYNDHQLPMSAGKHYRKCTFNHTRISTSQRELQLTFDPSGPMCSCTGSNSHCLAEDIG